jgi:hypothetical protein
MCAEWEAKQGGKKDFRVGPKVAGARSHAGRQQILHHKDGGQVRVFVTEPKRHGVCFDKQVLAKKKKEGCGKEKQVCMLSAKQCSGDIDEAFAMMTALIEEHCKGEIHEKDLYRTRDDRLKARRKIGERPGLCTESGKGSELHASPCRSLHTQTKSPNDRLLEMRRNCAATDSASSSGSSSRKCSSSDASGSAAAGAAQEEDEEEETASEDLAED